MYPVCVWWVRANAVNHPSIKSQSNKTTHLFNVFQIFSRHQVIINYPYINTLNWSLVSTQYGTIHPDHSPQYQLRIKINLPNPNFSTDTTSNIKGLEAKVIIGIGYHDAFATRDLSHIDTNGRKTYYPPHHRGNGNLSTACLHMAGFQTPTN